MDSYTRALFSYYENRVENIDRIGLFNLVDTAIESIVGTSKFGAGMNSVPVSELSTSESQKEWASYISEYAKTLISAVQEPEVEPESVSIFGLDSMVNGATCPFKVQSSHGTYYLKTRDPARLFGLEIYSMLNDLSIQPEFWFTQTDILEKEAEGSHPYDLNRPELDRRVNTDNYMRSRIKADIWLKHIGLTDIFEGGGFNGRLSNYLIRPSGEVVYMDFDAFVDRVEPGAFDQRKQDTIRELGINLNLYENIYEAEEFTFLQRVRKNKSEIEKLVSFVEKDAVASLSLKCVRGMLHEL